jgi:hypothetical protein
MESEMAVRNLLAGIGSILLLLAKIGLCLVFATYDRMVGPAAPALEPIGKDRALNLVGQG